MTVKISYADFIDLLTEKSGVSKTRADRFMHTLIQILKSGLDRDGTVTIRGLGQFDLRWQNARTGRNPQTGEALEIPAHYKIHFRPDSSLRRFFNRKYAKLKPKYIPVKAAKTISEDPPVREIKPDSVETDITEIPTSAPKTNPKKPVQPTKKKSGSIKWLLIALPILLLIIILAIVLRKEPKMPVAEKTPVRETQPVQEVVDAERSHAFSFAGSTHRIAAGDQLWNLSKQYYDSPYLWPYIYGENSEYVKNPDFLNKTGNLKIPPLEGDINHLSETDREKIANGFMKTYLAYKEMGRKDANHYLWTAYQLNKACATGTFADRIDQRDLERVNQMKGECMI